MPNIDFPAWVQALGAVIAIWFTVHQSRKEKVSKTKDADEKKQIIYAAISRLETRYGQEVFNLVWKLQGNRQASETLKNDPELVTLLEVQELARSIQIQQLPDPESVDRVLELLKNITEVRRIYLRNRALLKDHTDQLSEIERQSFLDQMSRFITDAKKIPGVKENG